MYIYMVKQKDHTHLNVVMFLAICCHVLDYS
jgi:hypothetical protein